MKQPRLLTVRFVTLASSAALLLCSGSLGAAYFFQEYKSGILWQEPAIIDPGQPGAAPADAIVLFDGTDLAEWDGGENWIIDNGVAIPNKGDIRSKRRFGDCQLHLEFATPAEVKGNGQGRGNSGVFLMDRYEVQVLDSFVNTTYYDGQCGAIYKQTPPIVNVCRGPGEWQTYDIIFTAPRFNEDGSVQSPGYVTVLHNGVVIQNHFELQGGTSFVAAASYSRHADKEPIRIQFHGNPVQFRNIWVRENVHAPQGEPLGGRPSPPPEPESV